MSIVVKNQMLTQVREEKNKCTACRKCMGKCPMMAAFCTTPKDLLQGVADQESMAVEIPFSCTFCGHCSHVCPQGVDMKNLFYEMRKISHDQGGGKVKGVPSLGVKLHQKSSFSKLFSTGVEGITANGGKQAMVFFPGCSLVAYDPDLVIDIYKDLKVTYPTMGIMLNCCGNPTRLMGDHKHFKGYLQGLDDHLACQEVKTLLVACPNCYKTFKEEGQHEVVSLWTLLLDKGLAEEATNRWSKLQETFSLHDPCPTRYAPEIHEAVRSLIGQLGLEIREMDYKKADTLCCGSGGMVNVTRPDVALLQKKKRSQECRTDYTISYCQECVISLRQGGQKTIHLLDLIYRPDAYRAGGFGQEIQSTSKQWLNRFKAKKKIRQAIKEM